MTPHQTQLAEAMIAAIIANDQEAEDQARKAFLLDCIEEGESKWVSNLKVNDKIYGVLKDFSITPEMLIYGIRREKDCTIFHLSCEDYKCIVGYYEGKWNPVQYFPTYQSALDEAIAQAQDRLAKLQALNTENHG